MKFRLKKNSKFVGMKRSQAAGWLFTFRAMLPLAACMLFLHACQDDELCEDVRANSLRIGFYQAGDDTGQWALVDSMRVFTLTYPQVPVYDMLQNVSVLELPLNPHSGGCAFILDFFHHRDTLWLQYLRETHFMSVECGFTLFFDIEELTHTSWHIQSATVVNKHVSNTLDEHVKVFLPADNGGL